MSYSFDTDGWDLFNTPFSSTPVRTAPAPSTHHAERSQQKPSEALLHNTPPVAQHNPQSSPKAAPPACQTADTQQRPVAVQKTEPAPATPVPNGKPAVKSPAPVQTSTTRQAPAAPPKATASASTQPVAQQKELVLDMSGSAAPAQDDTERRKAHEAAEAKRKAEWEARQAAKKQAEDAALQKLNDMSDEEALEASLKRISTETERLTRRNMKECVAAHIQELCPKIRSLPEKPCIRVKAWLTALNTSLVWRKNMLNRKWRTWVSNRMVEAKDVMYPTGYAINGERIISMQQTPRRIRRKRKRSSRNRIPAL